MFKGNIIILIVALMTGACGQGANEFDATGNFEADEVIVSAEAAGKIMALNVEEGQELKKGVAVGYIDTTQLHLKKRQLRYSMKAVLAKQPNTSVQLAAIEDQIATVMREKRRFENLLKEDAATQKQVDDIEAQLTYLQKQYEATKSSLGTTTQSLQSEVLPLEAQVAQIEDQINKSIIANPINGTVLVKYALAGEITGAGKALYKIADLSTIILRAYISGDQLSGLKLGQKVDVLVDQDKDSYKRYDGEITWISDKAEFTPKTIQTKEERSNLVYAIKIKVKNEGFLKLGMYGEVKFK
ncbi:MAG: efflux RND transporter periplasmic adaptor subunit [Cyclobacteriaceae bacterium]